MYSDNHSQVVSPALKPPRQPTLIERGYGILCVNRRPQIFAEHEHRELQIIIPFKNARMQATWKTETRRIQSASVNDEQVAVVASNQLHELNWKTTAAMGMFWLTPEFVERATDGAFRTDASRIVESYGRRDPLIRELGAALYAGWQESSLPNLYTESLANVLAVQLAKRYAVNAKTVLPPARGGLTAYQIGRTTDYINEHLSQDITLAKLADELDLSPYHFARQFKVATGKTPYQFLTELRVECAKALLKKSDLPILAVCFHCGFQTQSYFTTLFRKHTGTTPKAYREMR